jgi:ankyrin repeat protein
MVKKRRVIVYVCVVGAVLFAIGAFFVFWPNAESRFIRAVENGDVKTVSAMLNRNSRFAQVEQRHKAGSEPVLCIALRRDRKQIVRLLLSHGASPKNYPRALRFAQDLETLGLLIEQGANVNWRDGDNFEPTALHFFAAIGKTELAELLIDHGADLDARNNQGLTPLHSAALEGQLDTAKLLIAKGAKIDAKSKGNKTPFDYAVRPVWDEEVYRYSHERMRRCKEVATYLLTCGSSCTIFDLAWLGEMERVAEMIKSTPSLANAQANGEPLLFAAVRGGDGAVVEHLLANGAELRVKGRYQQTPLQVAAYIGHTDVVRILVDHGADIDERGPWGETALHWASVRGHMDVVSLLLERGADENVQTSSHTVDLNVQMHISRDPIEREFHLSKVREKQESAKKLGISLQMFSSPKVSFTEGDTPIHAATYWNRSDIVKLLIAKGANVNRANCWGTTPLHYAVVCRYHDIAQMLLDSGANPEAKTNEGLTPVELARKVKDRKLISLLNNPKYQTKRP